MNNSALSSDKKRGNTANNKSSSLWGRIRKLLISLRPHLAYYALLIISIAAIDFLIRPLAALDVRGFEVGKFSPRGVTAPFDFAFVDKITTRQKQEKAEALVSPVYILKPENLEKMQSKISLLTDAVRKTPLKEGGNTEEWVATVLETADFELDNDDFEDISQEPKEGESATQSVPQSIYESLVYYREYETLWKSIEKNVKASVGRGIAEDVTPLNLRGADGKPVSMIAIPVTLVSADGTEYAAPVQEIRTPMRFFEYFKQLLSVDFPDPLKDKAARKLAMTIVETAYSEPTLIYDKVKTEKQKVNVRNEIPPIIVQVHKEDSIIGKNDLLTANHLQKLNELQSRMRISFLAEIGYLVLSLLFVLLILKYLEAYQPGVAHNIRKTAVILLGVLLIFALARIAVHLSLFDQGNHKLSHVAYAVPLGALGVILTLLITSRMAVFCCALCSIYMGIIFSGVNHQPALPYVLVVFITSIVSIYSVARIRQRSDLYRAGGLAMIMACVLIFALSLIQFKHFEQMLQQAEELKWSLIWGGVNGGLISIFSMALLPIFEDFYGVVTDMKLLELSQKNEILQRLEQEAPGSYQHSMRVATIAETAADAIGANALLTRVGCYYHDIGKIMKAQYFVENQL
jgi:membrane-associated HD superfamily phosphohydrolase